MVLEIAAVLVGVYLLLVAYILSQQERITFPAPRYPLPSPQAAGIDHGESVSVTTTDGITLRGWYLQPSPPVPDSERAPGLIWFYGNYETVGVLAPLIEQLRPVSTAVLILDYRGYGTSDGKPTEKGLYLDAEAAWTYLSSREEVDADRISVYGRSLGSVLALFLSESKPVRSVVLDSPFTSARDMAKVHYWYVPRFMLRLKLDNLSRARQLNAPLLVLHGSEDDIAPMWMGKAIAEAAHDATLVVYDGAGHNDIYDVAGARYREALHGFLLGEQGDVRR